MPRLPARGDYPGTETFRSDTLVDAIRAFDSWTTFAQLNLGPLVIGGMVALVLVLARQKGLAVAFLATSAIPLVLGGTVLALELATWEDPGPTCDWFCEPGLGWIIVTIVALYATAGVAALVAFVAFVVYAVKFGPRAFHALVRRTHVPAE